jgi:DNA-binding transcriptional LysR family regulator
VRHIVPRGPAPIGLAGVPSVDPTFLPRALDRFVSFHPEMHRIVLEPNSRDVQGRLFCGELDLAIIALGANASAAWPARARA